MLQVGGDPPDDGGDGGDQEEIQEEMMVMNPKILIKTFTVNSIASHPMIQTRVETMGADDVEPDTRIFRSLANMSTLQHS